MSNATLYDFWAPWCGPCVAMKPAVEAIEKHYGERLAVVRVNVDEDTELAEKYGIRSIPTMVFLDGAGVEKMRLVGGRSFEALKSALDLVLDKG